MIDEVTHDSKKSKKRKQKHDHSVDEDTTSEDFVNLDLSTKKHKKKHTKSEHNNYKKSEIEVAPDSSIVVEQEGKREKKKKHRKSKNDSLGLADQDSTVMDAHHLGSEDDETPRKKVKKTKVKQDLEDSSSLLDASSHETKRKGKKQKQKSLEESTLGMVDTDILQQAKTNLGLPMIDKLETETLKHDELHESDVKKEKKKKKKEKKSKEATSETPNVGTRNDRALQYLRLWGSHRKSWKFNKMMQIQLLHIMYDQSVLSDEDFESMLLYLDGMKGKGREKTKEDAKKILDQAESEDAVDANKEERARQIYQILS